MEEQQWATNAQVSTTSARHIESGVRENKKRIEIYRGDLKSQRLDDYDKEFLKVRINLLEDEVKTYKELIAQTRRKK